MEGEWFAKATKASPANVMEAQLQKSNTNKSCCKMLGFSVCGPTKTKPFARTCFARISARISAWIFARIFCMVFCCMAFCTDFCTDFLHGFLHGFLHELFAQIFCTDFLLEFVYGFLHGFFARLFFGCPKPLAEKRENFTEKIP